MSTKIAPVKVHVWPTKHAGEDKWKVVLDKPGGAPSEELKTRYKQRRDAWRGALRNLKAWKYTDSTGTYWRCVLPGRDANVHPPRSRPIVFIYEKPKPVNRSKRR